MNKTLPDLPKLLPKGAEFPKLRGHGSPYLCDGWRHDTNGVFCMYYEFSGYKKRAPLSEIEAAANYLTAGNIFDRPDFRLLCPVANRDGPCGFAVIGRVLEEIFGAQYIGRDGFVLPDSD